MFSSDKQPQLFPWRGSRGRALGLGGLGAVWLLTRGRAFAAPRRLLSGLTVTNEGLAYAGDNSAFATVSPLAHRATARFDFHLARRATISLSILATGQGASSERPSVVAETTLRRQDLVARPGNRTLRWTPPPTLPARTYIARLTARTPGAPTQTLHTVVRVLGVEAAFSERSALPGDQVTLVVRTDAKKLSVQMLRSGPEAEPTYANNEIKGVPAGNRPRSTGRLTGMRPHRSPSRSDPTGRAASTRRGSMPTTVASASRRSSSDRRRHRYASRSRSRPVLGAHTTSTTPTATAGATRGTHGGRRCMPT